jgi:hypothetical protein
VHRGRAHALELGGDERLDVLARDRVEAGRHPGAREIPGEQPDRLEVAIDRPGREVPRREPDLERLGEAADPAEVGLERDPVRARAHGFPPSS